MCKICEEADVITQASESALTVLRNRADEGLALPNVVRLARDLSEQFKTIVINDAIVHNVLFSTARAYDMDYDGKPLQDAVNRELTNALAVAFITGVEFGKTGHEIETWPVEVEPECD